MENSKAMTCKQAKDYDIVNYLSALGIEPVKIRGNNYWYLSPLRDEKTASFKVGRKINRWKDFGDGRGGNLIDLAILYHNCTVGEFLQILQTKSFLPSNQPIHLSKDPTEGKIIILQFGPIQHPALFSYLQNRRIPFRIAEPYCKEVHFELYGKHYFSLGFQNDSGGFELRNSFFKGSSTPKTITSVISGDPTAEACVFEGHFDFLSYLTLMPSDLTKAMDFFILNSLVFFEHAREVLESYKVVNLFLDNDSAGQKVTVYALGLNSCYHDQRLLYKNHEDLNQFHCHFGNPQKLSGLPPGG